MERRQHSTRCVLHQSTRQHARNETKTKNTPMPSRSANVERNQRKGGRIPVLSSQMPWRSDILPISLVRKHLHRCYWYRYTAAIYREDGTVVEMKVSRGRHGYHDVPHLQCGALEQRRVKQTSADTTTRHLGAFLECCMRSFCYYCCRCYLCCWGRSQHRWQHDFRQQHCWGQRR